MCTCNYVSTFITCYSHSSLHVHTCTCRHGLDSNVLRFVAKMKTAKSVDAERLFIIFYHLSDDTIGIFEPPMRNSGI